MYEIVKGDIIFILKRTRETGEIPLEGNVHAKRVWEKL